MGASPLPAPIHSVMARPAYGCRRPLCRFSSRRSPAALWGVFVFQGADFLPLSAPVSGLRVAVWRHTPCQIMGSSHPAAVAWLPGALLGPRSCYALRAGTTGAITAADLAHYSTATPAGPMRAPTLRVWVNAHAQPVRLRPATQPYRPPPAVGSLEEPRALVCRPALYGAWPEVLSR